VDIMSRRFQSYSGYAFAFLIGLSVVPGYQILDRSEVIPESVVEQAPKGQGAKLWLESGEKLLVAQGYSRTCVTGRGSCKIPKPQPTGSRCYCGDQPGTVVR
jgi:hypothetical protein